MSSYVSLLSLLLAAVSFAAHSPNISAQSRTTQNSAANPGPQSSVPELAGGSWGRGRRIFYSGAAECFRCHTVGETGISLGPTWSELTRRDYASVLKDVTNPSATVHSDFKLYEVELHDGSKRSGVLRTIEGRLLLGDSTGALQPLAQDRIREKKVIEGSVMPEGLLDDLSEEEVRDLMTFLLTPPPSMPIAGKVAAPPMRSMKEVADALAGSTPLPKELRPLRVVLVAGTKDHGPGEHDYPAWQIQWGSLLAAADETVIDTAWDFPSEEQLQSADVLLFFQKGDWNAMRAQKMDAFFARGGGAIYLHWAVNGGDRAPQFAERIGMASKAGSIRYRHGPLRLELSNTDHPILRNLDELDLLDESYWTLAGDSAQITLLASSSEEGKLWPQIWCYEREKGRVFVAIPGHYNWTFDDPLFRIVLLRGIAWSCREPIDRFNELVLPGARVK
ncbi:ThuA domain-containing protein [Pirellulaceae bacterium SH467]